VRHVWPAPPEQARVEYVGTITTEEDSTGEGSWAENVFELVFGKGEIGVLLSPYGVAAGQDETVFVTDSAGGAVHAFDLKRRKYRQFTSVAKDRTLQRPVAVAIAEENLYVVDSELNEVCVFDRTGKFKFSFGSGQLTRPSGIAYSHANGRVYVSDTGSHRVAVFDMTGKLLGTLGSRGTGPAQFNFPTSLWVDREGNLYVSDTLNYRVQVFSARGGFLRMFGEHGDRPGYFAHPSGVATDTFGHIYVADRQFENIQVFDRYGSILMAFGQEGSGVGEFWLPSGICIDGRNRIYVADTFNKRIQVFQLLEVAGNGQ
jgi:DNA-binding beta-propeller fold protein YncE